MRAELPKKPDGWDIGIKLYPQNDHEIVRLGVIHDRADNGVSELHWLDTHPSKLNYLYISLQELIRIASEKV